MLIKINGFKKTGIFSYNRESFIDSDFAPSYVTDRSEETAPLIPPIPNAPQLNAQTIEKENVSPNNYNNLRSSTSGDDPMPSTSGDNPVPSTFKDNPEFSPEIVSLFQRLGQENRLRLKERKGEQQF